jgi:hypothetical protein
MKKLIQLVASVCLLVAPALAQTAPVGYVTLHGSHISDASGNLEANGTIYFAPVTATGAPLSFRVNGNGQAVDTPVSATVTNGVFSLFLADTSLTFPANVCYSVTVVDNVSGNQLLGSGYGCVQPAQNTAVPNTWCASGSCNFDDYPPSLSALQVTTAPNISIGTVTTSAPGSGAAVSVTGEVPNFSLNFQIPQGLAATMAVNSVTNCAPGTPATVTNTGTVTNAELNFCVPTGAPGTVSATGTGGNFATSGTATNGKTVSKLPRVDVTYPDFGSPSSCTYAADSTGINDSTCAINAAVAWAVAQQANGQYPPVYFPEGTYKITSALRLPCFLSYYGDGPSSTTLKQVTNNANAVTVISTTNSLLDPWLCSGSLDDMTVTSSGSHLFTASLVEVNSASGFKLNRLKLFNGGGRGLVLNGSSERTETNDLQIDSVRYPLMMSTDSNEDHFFKTNIDSPGITMDGYCWSQNCPNGVPPNNNWTSAQTLQTITCTSGTCTVVVQGGNSGSALNGDSPIPVDAAFTIAGVSDLTAVNGTWTASTVTNATPSANEYTITASIPGASGAATVTSATFQPTVFPTHRCAVWASGANVAFYGGSIKTLEFTCGVQMWISQNNSINQIYFEGYPINGSARLNANIEEGGLAPKTTLAGSLAWGATGNLALADVSNFPNYVNDPEDDVLNTLDLAMVGPADFAWGSTTCSAYVHTSTGGCVQQGQYEIVGWGSVDGNGNMQVDSRDLSYQGYATSAPSGTVWPAGSLIEMLPANLSYGGGLIANGNHFNAIGQATSPYYSYCNDTGIFICSDVILGNVMDGFAAAPLNVTAGMHGSGALATFLGNTFFSGTSEAQGQGDIKITYSGSLTTLNAGVPNLPGETSEIANNQFGTQLSLPAVIPVQYGGGNNANMAYFDASSGTYINTYIGGYESRVNGASAETSTVGQNPSAMFAWGKQHSGSSCDYDTPAVGGTYAMNSWCELGGVLNPTAGGWQYRVRNSSTGAWYPGFTVTNNNSATPGPTNSVTATVNGNLNVNGTIGGTAGANIPNLSGSNYFSGALGVQGVSIGDLSNLLPYSSNFTASGWDTPVGTAPTITTAQADSWGGTTASEFTFASGTNQYAFEDSGSPATAGTVYNISGWFRGATGTETITLGDTQSSAATFSLSTQWKYYSFSVTASSTQTQRIFELSSSAAESIYVAGVSVTLGSNGDAYLATNGSAVSTPIAAVTVGGDQVLAATTSTPTGTCTPNGYVPVLIGGVVVHVATCD